MAFKVFTNRSVQYPFRRKLTLVAGTTDVYEITRTGVEGTVFAEGVMFNEANMGEMQDAIEERFTPTKKTITWASENTPTSSLCYKIGNMVHIDFKMPFPTGIANATELVGTVPPDCIPLGGIAFTGSGHANRIGFGATYADNFGILGRVNELGGIYIASEFGIEMFGACMSMEYFVD